MFTTSPIYKASLYFRFDEDDELLDAALLIMKGSVVIRCTLFGPMVDENNDELFETVLESEVDESIFSDQVQFKAVTCDGNFESVKSYVLKELRRAKRIIHSLDEENRFDDDDYESEYVLYYDNRSDRLFFDDLYEAIEGEDPAILPTHFNDFYLGELTPKQLFDHYGYEVAHNEESPISHACLVGVIQDIQMGYN